jgi:hypothetical protein
VIQLELRWICQPDGALDAFFGRGFTTFSKGVEMPILFDLRLLELTDQAYFESLHWMGYRLADRRVFVDLPGIVLVGLRGGSSWVG